jgi:hypothetical protein
MRLVASSRNALILSPWGGREAAEVPEAEEDTQVVPASIAWWFIVKVEWWKMKMLSPSLERRAF